MKITPGEALSVLREAVLRIDLAMQGIDRTPCEDPTDALVLEAGLDALGVACIITETLCPHGHDEKALRRVLPLVLGIDDELHIEGAVDAAL